MLNETINLIEGVNSIPLNFTGISANYYFISLEKADGSLISRMPVVIE